MAETCQAAVFNGDGTYDVREFAVPDPPDGGAVVRVEAVGLCGSDLAQRAGVELFPGAVFPVVPGHEIVGRVWKLGRDADGLGVAEGDRVAVDEVVATEPRLVVYGYTFPADDGAGLYGGYGEYMVVLPGTRLHRLSDRVPPEEATLFEPLASAVNWAEVVDVGPGDVVVVQGPGHQGLAVVEAVLAAGAGTVVVTGAAGDELRLDTARAIGAHHTVDVTNDDPVEIVRELTGGRMADVVMDVSPAKQTVPLCLDLVRFGGRILLAGLKHNAPVDGLVTDKIVVGGLRVFGGTGFTPASMARAVELIDTGAVDTGPLRGEVFGLDGIDEAFALLSRTEPGRDAVRVTLAHSTPDPG
jgi:2-desacetyl-2-hydroxyethyl bacteriochlorophyllide A dehydrogenase